MQENKEYIQEDEIDLKELFLTIWQKRWFIFIFTSIITLLAVVYVFIKTSIYSVNALFEIGYYKTEKNDSVILDNANELSKKLSTLFIDLRKNEKDKEYEIDKISVSKGMKNFIEISSEATTNELAVKGINEILKYTQKEHIKILNDVKEKNELEIKNIKLIISNIQNEKLVNLNNKIKLHEENISNLEDQMKFVNETLKKINSLDPSIAALKLMEKRDISNEIIESKSNLYDLYEERNSLITIEINKLEERKKLLESLSLSHNYKNTQIIGKININDNPSKPKKKLTVIIAFVTGFILSIFLVFFMQFISNLRKENKIEK